jgi:asparagine synthase (glutamine-hydrolysing)
MTASLRHRGPDGEGFLIEGPLGLGMRRLAIIDVAGGGQPIFNEDRSVAVVLNGEIYNFKELRTELQQLGHEFRTASDTEVLVHAYESWGDDLVQHLNGMWAFALWDVRRRRLLLSRDRLGIKPLHYSWDGETLLFGSEIKALLRAGLPARPNWELLDAYIAFGFVPEPYSMIHGVHKLPAGCNLELEAGSTPRLKRYWEVPIVHEVDARRDEDAVVEEFGALLRDAVRLQMRSDVPLGAFLSGGLDSGSIVALASEHSSHALRTFTIGFDLPEHDERDLARQVAGRYRTEHRERRVEPADLEAGLRTLGDHFDEPFGDTSALATWVVSHLAREHVTVVLSGDGGDEVLAGYTRYPGEKFSSTYAALPRFIRRHIVPTALAAARAVAPRALRGRLDRVGRVLDAANMSFVDRVTAKQSWSTAAVRSDLLRPDAARIRPAREFVEEVIQACPATAPFHRLNWFDLKLVLPGQMLTKVDRMSMAASLEARVPFLDHRLVELMAPVSATVKLPGYVTKHVLRRALADRLPPPLLNERKRGFNVPMSQWFRDRGAVELLSERLGAGHLDAVVNRAALDDMIASHQSGRVDHGPQLWNLLQLAQWQAQLGRRLEPA